MDTVGDPLEEATDLGPVISAEARMRILRYIAYGQREGATLACGGGVSAGPQFERGFWVEPTIFTEVRNDMTIYKELEPGKSVEGASWAGRAAAEAEVQAPPAPPAGEPGARLTRK